MMTIMPSIPPNDDVVCYVKVILTNQKYTLIIFSAQLITLRGIFTQCKIKEHFGAACSGYY